MTKMRSDLSTTPQEEVIVDGGESREWSSEQSSPSEGRDGAELPRSEISHDFFMKNTKRMLLARIGGDLFICLADFREISESISTAVSFSDTIFIEGISLFVCDVELRDDGGKTSDGLEGRETVDDAGKRLRADKNRAKSFFLINTDKAMIRKHINKSVLKAAREYF